MAFSSLPSFRFSTIPRIISLPPLPQHSTQKSNLPKCMAMAIATPLEAQTIVRREANYHPPIWEHDYLQSLTSQYQGDTYKTRAEKLKEDVRKMLNKVEGPLSKLESIDTLQRLGIHYHFEVEINTILENICNSDMEINKEDLYATSLKFRLLRQHGYDISQDVFNIFLDEDGKFKAYLSEDTNAMLYLYEASYLSTRKDKILDGARDFASKHLKEHVKKKMDNNKILEKLVNHALELPLHWRVVRLEARWFIDMYENYEQDIDHTLLQLAKLDYNMVQAIHLEDLKHASRWWKHTSFGENLSFARDRLMENYIWNVEVNFEPHLQYCRRMSTKVFALITSIDDVYDVYGTLDELKLFTDIIERWDVNAINQLPNYMKICFLALFNSINDMGFDALKEKNFNTIPHLKETWVNICKAYMVEAKWFNNKYKPTLEEYLENAWISIGAQTMLVHAYSFISNSLTNDDFDDLKNYPDLIRCSSVILRLANDLGTSKDELQRGDTLKSIQCYMHEKGVSEEKAREHVHKLISETWKEMNEHRTIKASSPFHKLFVDTAMNLARMSQCMYQYGDGHGIENRETKDRVLSLLIDPIPLT